MKKIKIIIGICLSFCVAVSISMFGLTYAYAKNTNSNELVLPKPCKSAYLMDYDSSTVIYKKDEEKRLPIASMCKIMTLLLSFEEIERGNISLEEEIVVGENASKMGGSQVFLETNGRYTVDNLLKSIVVCSANDSCVAMAERIAGSEQAFVARMNERAIEVGANNTLFANCTGLPKEVQYSCSKDVALMLQKLLSHEGYYKYSRVWLDKFNHPEGRYTEITNTNKLIRFYDGCDGGKTGFTNEAGFCLASTAKRSQMRLVSVIIGANTSAERFQTAKELFNYAFANYTSKQVLCTQTVLNEKCEVRGGKQEFVAVSPAENVFIFSKRNDENNITIGCNFELKVKAPLEQGKVVGQASVYKDNVLFKSVPLVTAENIEKSSIFDSVKNIGENW